MMYPFLRSAVPLLAEGSVTGGMFSQMAPILLMFAVVYFIVLRPSSKEEKERRKRVGGLKRGDQVVLQGGILGRITNVDDPEVAMVEIADKVRVRVIRSKIEDTADSLLKKKEKTEKASPISPYSAKAASSKSATKGT